ncbi:MAG: Xylose isomerase domain protein barrel [Gaiellaceae bacterium]|nr:Xylose isomerase domain protein barrel [Gaiellaceae bacterium]
MTVRATPPFAISFMSANYVAKELGYGAATEWGPFDAATNAAFEPLETFAGGFDDLLATITGIGFDTIDLWFAHLNWRWASPEHVALAREALARRDVRVVSLAGSVGATTDELAAACRLANDLDVDLVAGVGEVVHRAREGAVAVLREHGVRFGLENHPEKTPQEVLDTIGDDADVLGATVDTGWWATQAYDPVAAIGELSERLFHVHLKDVEEPGTHVSCMHGEGCANVAGCVEKVLAIGYAGPLSIEHEPYDRDPTAECVRMLARIRAQLAATEVGRRG